MNIFLGVLTLSGFLLVGKSEASPALNIPSGISLPTPGNRTRSLELEVLVNDGPKEWMKCTTKPDKLTVSRNGIRDTSKRWPGYFHVYIDPVYSDDERGIINNALYQLMQAVPCLRFGVWDKGQSPSGDYVHVFKGTDGCWSHVGRQGGGQQMSMNERFCYISVDNFVHEFIHALGFHHEHQRHDRDDYINVHRENIQQEAQIWFDKLDARYWNTYGVEYNHRSIMHYPSTAFSSNGRPVMTTKSGQEIPWNDKFQESDKRKLNAMYTC